MKQNHDIREYKKVLRSKYKAVRDGFSPAVRAGMDEQILLNITKTRQYRDCEVLMTYVSIGSEVDTKKLILTALADGKKTAVPYCIANTRNMDFYIINSLEELKKRSFDVPEPNVQIHEKLEVFSGSLCILPGLAFDKKGYRLGYGGGYYDRFLSKGYNGETAGICYSGCFIDEIKHGRYDVPCDFIITEKGLVNII